jgi:hypothetical protein
VSAQRNPGQPAFAWMEDPRTQERARNLPVVIDATANLVRIDIPRAWVALSDPALLNGVCAESRVYGVLTVTTQDLAPESGVSLWFDERCSTVLAAPCPPVADPAGDARHTQSVIASVPMSENEPAADLLAVGVETGATTLVVSMRVAGLATPMAERRNGVGWTASWGYGGTRWWAQAARPIAGEPQFTVGSDLTEPDSQPAPAYEQGTQVAGSIDPGAGIVRVVVPRAAVGSPPDGEALDQFGAVSWTDSRLDASTTDFTSGSMTADRTGTARPLVGVLCPA